ncbi:hypothetical protein CASFOL_008158 [Castilleja foliolosa]|uniref:Uncharacterized protein n=1 Tax=Castilleja foliolosa TaxID=1961234 RepID=A0ABD3DY62_9LAMI
MIAMQILAATRIIEENVISSTVVSHFIDFRMSHNLVLRSCKDHVISLEKGTHIFSPSINWPLGALFLSSQGLKGVEGTYSIQ